MSDNTNEIVVIAVFGSQGEADEAIDGLKSWDQADPDVKLGAIGTIVRHGDKLKTHVGHKFGRGAGVGAIVGMIAGVLSGGATVLGGLIAGSLLGVGVGGLMKDSLHLTKQEIEALGDELDAGKVAVVVTCDEAEIEPIVQQLETFGGTTRTYGVPQAALAEATQAMAVAEGAQVPAPVEAQDVAAVDQSEPFQSSAGD